MRTRLIALALILAIATAACGDDGDPVVTGDPDPTADPADDQPTATDDPTGATPTPADDDPTGATPKADDDPTGATPTPADDDPPLGAGPYPIAELTIAYSHRSQGVEFGYKIVCLGDTATLLGDVDGVRDQSACAALADPAVQRRLIDGPPAGRICTEQYGGDDQAVITGRIDDRAVDTIVDRSNGCGIDDWDRLLRDILPTPIGAL